ncbi:hypothetical protein Moror_10756 [Moniliophthora roreri MCA 2997]|uniref:Uncharacterized protein n=1 Tax=Moniliophthora roreri (strain MCA 2997) TaxID=1381753 RepID=V2X2L3_MONRO|nr:hypothetical protein Moror_10756 [Moniliophthora roreri MCA 2997]
MSEFSSKVLHHCTWYVARVVALGKATILRLAYVKGFIFERITDLLEVRRIRAFDAFSPAEIGSGPISSGEPPLLNEHDAEHSFSVYHRASQIIPSHGLTSVLPTGTWRILVNRGIDLMISIENGVIHMLSLAAIASPDAHCNSDICTLLVVNSDRYSADNVLQSVAGSTSPAISPMDYDSNPAYQ